MLILYFIPATIVALAFLPQPTTHINPPPYTITQQYSEPLIIPEPKKPEPSKVTLCNCYAYTKTIHYPDLPSTSVIKANIRSEISDVAVFYYPDIGLYHYAAVIASDGYNFTIDEANYRHCARTTRELTLDYPGLLGFYKVQ